MTSHHPFLHGDSWLNPQWHSSSAAEQDHNAADMPAPGKSFKGHDLSINVKTDINDPFSGEISKKVINDDTFLSDRPLKDLVIEASGLDPKLFHPGWFEQRPDLEDLIVPLSFRRIVDASGDGSLAEVFEDGALKVSINPSDYDHLTRLSIDRFGRISSQQMGVDVNVTAKDLGTGEVIDLGTQTINPDSDNFLVNLKDKLDAIGHWSLRDQYAITVETSFGDGANRKVLESFEETITLIRPLQWGTQHRGDETANDLTYRNMGPAVGSGRIYQGRGGTDILNLEGISSSDVHSFNGRSGIDGANAAALGQQAFYAGTVFDALSLNNGDELYLQGIERLRFSDVTIDLTPNLDATSERQWNTQVMDVNGAWRFNTGSDDVVLVSLDTGFDANGAGAADVHGDLSRAVNRNSTNTMVPDEDGNDQSDHGHQAMSVMAAVHDGSDVAGVSPNTPLWAYNVYSGGSDLQDAIQDAINNRQDGQRLVFQGGIQGEDWLTSGGTEADMNALLRSADDFGFFSIAAGNGGGTAFVDPNYLTSVSGVAKAASSHDNVASVGALQATGWEFVDGLLNPTDTDIAGYSNRGSNLTLVAATDSRSILNADGATPLFGGTSAANPNLAGVAALVWSENAALDGGELREILTSSAMDLGAGGFDNTFGFGLVNAEGAIRRAYALDENLELASFWTNQDFLA